MVDAGYHLELLSPYGAEAVRYTWPLQQADKKHQDGNSKLDGSIEIIETIRWVFEDLPMLRDVMHEDLSQFSVNGDLKNYHSMKNLCDKYNGALKRTLALNPKGLAEKKRPSVGLLKHIIQKSYNQAIADPEKLNEYPAWSPEVYGETSFEFVSQMIENLDLRPNDIFIDLGSGVGQVVLQVAATVNLAGCIGIEKADVPCVYAKELDRQFKFWMEWFGKLYTPYQLIKGDFFDNKYKSMINSATFIFVNNYAFGPNVDHQLKRRFEELPDGTRIVSSKAFSPVNFRITDRNQSDIGTMMHVKELQPAIKESVSWTPKSVSYFCHTIDRTKIEHFYFEKMKTGPKNREDNLKGKGRRSNGSSLRDSDSSSNDGTENKKSSSRDEEEEVYYGPTTRKAWSEWVSSRSKENKNTAGNQTSGGNGSQGSNSSNEDSSKPESEETASSTKRDVVKRNKKKPGRPRKYSPGVSAVVKRAASGTKKVAGVNEPRRPGRPPKSPKKNRSSCDVNSLDMLHAQTLLSISTSGGHRTSPAPGTVYQKLDPESSLSNTPSVAVKHSSSESMEEALNSLMDNFRSQFIQFLSYMQLPEYKISVARQIEEEKKRNQLLTAQVNAAEKSIRVLQERGVASLKAKLSDVGITAATSDEVLDKAREMITKNKMLQEKELKLSSECSHHEAVFMEIGKAYDKLKGSIDGKIFPDFISNLERNKRLFVDVGRMESSVASLEKASFYPRSSQTRGTPSPATSSLSSSSSSSGLKESPSGVSNASDQVNSLIIAQLNSGASVATTKTVRGSRAKSTPSDVPPATGGRKQQASTLQNNEVAPSVPIKEPKPKKEPKKRVAKSAVPNAPSTDSVVNGSNGNTLLKSQLLSLPPVVEPQTVNPEPVNKSIISSSTKSVDSPKGHANRKSPKSTESSHDEKPSGKNIGNQKSPKHEASPRHVGSSSSSSSTAIPSYIPSASIKASPPQEGADGKERLTLTLVLDRRDNSASVKSPSKSPPNHNSSGSNSYSIVSNSSITTHKSSPKHPHLNESVKRKTGPSSPSEEKLTKKSRAAKMYASANSTHATSSSSLSNSNTTSETANLNTATSSDNHNHPNNNASAMVSSNIITAPNHGVNHQPKITIKIGENSSGTSSVSSADHNRTDSPAGVQGVITRSSPAVHEVQAKRESTQSSLSSLTSLPPNPVSFASSKSSDHHVSSAPNHLNHNLHAAHSDFQVNSSLNNSSFTLPKNGSSGSVPHHPPGGHKKWSKARNMDTSFEKLARVAPGDHLSRGASSPSVDTSRLTPNASDQSPSPLNVCSQFPQAMFGHRLPFTHQVDPRLPHIQLAHQQWYHNHRPPFYRL